MMTIKLVRTYAITVLAFCFMGADLKTTWADTESAADGSRYEAEEAYLSGTTVSDGIAGYSGSGYVTGFETEQDFVEFTVHVEEDGYYPLVIRYAAPSGDKTNFIQVNGSTAGEAFFPKSDPFREAEFGQVLLDEGENKIRIARYWGYFDVDYIKVGLKQNRPDIKPVQPDLVTPAPTAETKALMTYLTGQYGKGILAGQQASTTEELAHIRSLSGKLPAILGFSASDLGETALQWARSGGLISAEWHWEAPMGGKEYFAEKTKFDLAAALDPNTLEYTALINDIDDMAQKLKKLQAANVPVLWRPLHEAEGGYFWWGAKGPEAAKALYKLMFERFTRYHGLNNLIWVWTTSDTAHSMDWYPGDAYADIVGVDRYIRDGDYNPLMSTYDALVRMYEGKKLVAFLENGPIPDPQQLKKNKVGWLYFNTWNGKYIMDGKINSEQHIRYVYNHPYVITLDKLPSQRIYGVPPVPYSLP